jgi:sugar phosphate permease
VTLGVATFAQGAFVAAFFSVPVLAPALIDEYDLSVRQLGLVLACIDIGSALALMAWGLLADRVGERLVVAVGLGAASVAFAFAAHAQSFEALTLLLTCTGALGCCVYTATGRAVSAAFEDDERGVALAIRHSSNLVAGALAALILPRLAEPADVTRAFTGVAIAIALASVMSALLLPRGGRRRAAARSSRRHPGRDRRIWGISAGSGLLILAQGCLLSFFVVYLHERQDLGAGRAAMFFAISQLTGATVRLAVGRWSDVRRARIRPLLAIAAGFSAALFATAALAGASVALALPPLMLATILSMSWAALSYTAVAELGGDRAGTAIGIQQTILSLGSLTAPIAFALIVDGAGWSTAFAAAGAIALAGILVIRQFRYEVLPAGP